MQSNRGPQRACLEVIAVLLCVMPLVVFAQSGESGAEYSGSYFRIAVPDSWFGYWADDLSAAKGGLTEEIIETLDIVFLTDRQVDTETLSLMETPKGIGFVVIMMGPLPPDEQEKPEGVWVEGFYKGFERNVEDGERGTIDIAGWHGYYLAGMYSDKSYSSDQFDEPMRTFIAATRTDKAAFIFNGMLPESNDGDIIVFMTGALSAVEFH